MEIPRCPGEYNSLELLDAALRPLPVLAQLVVEIPQREMLVVAGSARVKRLPVKKLTLSQRRSAPLVCGPPTCPS